MWSPSVNCKERHCFEAQISFQQQSDLNWPNHKEEGKLYDDLFTSIHIYSRRGWYWCARQLSWMASLNHHLASHGMPQKSKRSPFKSTTLTRDAQGLNLLPYCQERFEHPDATVHSLPWVGHLNGKSWLLTLACCDRTLSIASNASCGACPHQARRTMTSLQCNKNDSYYYFCCSHS